MPAKKQRQAEKNDAVKSTSRKKTKTKGYSDVPEDEAPMIIKGSAQGPGNLVQFVIRFEYPLDFTYEAKSADAKPYVYTLPSNLTVRNVKVESSACKQCDIDRGDFKIEFFLE